MGLARGFILSEDKRRELRTKLEEPQPHCYFCGSPYVCIIKGERGPTTVTCLICDKVCSISHKYNAVL